MEARGRFQLHLPGLLKVQAEHLYSTQRVGVRELIQNAHDSCVRRALERGEPGYHPRIDLHLDRETRTLRVADNGSGLTEADIHTYLTVIGRGYTRELRERLVMADDLAASRGLIGQFGIGFLSAFLLASEVVVHTRPPTSPALRWSSTGDEEFDLTAGERSEVGTTVELRLKPSALFLLHEGNLTDVVREYADFVATPIHVQDSPGKVNLGTPPWEEPDGAAASRSYIRRRFGEAEPIWVLPLTDGVIDLGHDTVTVPLRGLLFVPSGSVASLKEYGDVAVLIRRMAITGDDKDLLPTWARFVRGVIDCPTLQPTASREAVRQDNAFEEVRRVLADQLEAGLRGLAEQNDAVWRRIVHGHSDLIMGWASRDPDFFRLVADSVPLRTSRGRLSIPEYLRASGNVLYDTIRDLGPLQDKILAEARDVPAIDASWFAVPAFLADDAALHPGISLVRLDDDLGSWLRPAAADELGDLPQLASELGFTVVASSFKPVDLPALMTYPADAETLRDATSALADGLFPDGFSGLMQGYVDQRRAVTRIDGTLHLNASCPLIRRLATETMPPERKQAALAVVAYFARLFCGRTLDAPQATADLAAWQRSLDRLVRP